TRRCNRSLARSPPRRPGSVGRIRRAVSSSSVWTRGSNMNDSRRVRTRRGAAAARCLSLLLVAGDAACNGPFDAPNQNYGTLQDLKGRVAVLTATQGLLVPTRASFFFNAQTLGILGREGYNLDVSNPQAIPNWYTVLGPDLAAGVWTNAYRVFKQANLVVNALDGVVDMTDAEKEGIRGFAQTM